MAARPRSAIPVGTQFTPDLVRLRPFLSALQRCGGDRAALERAVWRPPVHRKSTSVPSSRRRASLPLEAAVQYGLLERRSYKVTDLAKRLVRLRGPALRDEFARHVLLNLGGLRVVQGIEQMRADGLTVGADPLARYLTAQGFRVSEHNTAINSMRMWLERAGLFSARGWVVNPDLLT